MYGKVTGAELSSQRVPQSANILELQLLALMSPCDLNRHNSKLFHGISQYISYLYMVYDDIYIYIYNCNIVYITLHNLFIVSYKSDSKKYLNKFTHLLVRSRPVAFFRHVQRGKFLGFRSRWWLDRRNLFTSLRLGVGQYMGFHVI